MDSRYMTRERPTLLAIHAHPDDEAIFTGGLLARSADLGWRTVLVVATSGERGLAPSTHTNPTAPDTGDHRRQETLAAAEILGIDRVEFLGYGDSGAEYTEFAPDSLAAANIACVTSDVQAIVDDERPVLVTSYDHQGIYGHPDHIAVHAIGRSLNTSAGLYESTISRPALARLHSRWIALGMTEDTWPTSLTELIGIDHEDDPDNLVTLAVGKYQVCKDAAIAAHDSQIITASASMGLPPGVFHSLVATEWFHCVRPAAQTPF
jgi:LmbE family N-acetylglucosaminyl deacetylase